jgi:hypothetical protein
MHVEHQLHTYDFPIVALGITLFMYVILLTTFLQGK